MRDVLLQEAQGAERQVQQPVRWKAQLGSFGTEQTGCASQARQHSSTDARPYSLNWECR
jgi:hypothetical protein